MWRGLYTFAQQNYKIQGIAIDQKINRLQLGALKRMVLPSLALNAYLGQQYFGNQLNLDKARFWYGNSYVNFALRIPISAHFTVQSNLKKELLNSTLLENQRQQERKLARLKQILQLAKEVKKEQEAAFREGRLILSEYNRACLDHNKAMLDIWQAEFDLVKLLLDKTAA